MNKVHYYFGWFEGVVPPEVARAINNDLAGNKSIAIITTTPIDHEETDKYVEFTRSTWFAPAGIIFEEYRVIDHRISKEKAHELLKNASAILLHGGYPTQLKNFIAEYDMAAAIRNSNANVIMGASAGGMNMAAKFVDDRIEPAEIRDGLGLDNFALESHAYFAIESLEGDEHTKINLMPLSQEIDVYLACTESTIRIQNGRQDIHGDVFVISDSKISKLPESGF